MTRAWIPLALAALVPFVACKANVEESCEDGMCTGATVAAASSGGDSSCVYGDTHGFPCDVYTIIHENCHGCHIKPPLNGAPFPLLTYADTQAEYYNTPDKIWQHMKLVIEPGALPGMPFGKNPPGLPEPLLNTLRAWFATCEAGMCETGQGIGGGGGGGVGGGGTTSSTTNGSTSTGTAASTSTGN
jgi:hypothetical protein